MNRAIVIDNGSFYCKSGFAGDEIPTSIFRSCIGRTKYANINSNMRRKSYYFGIEAQRHSHKLKISYPFNHGYHSNWDDIELIWDHIFQNILKTTPKESPVLLTEPPLNPKENKEKMTQIMFETFDTPAMYVAIQSVLAMYSIPMSTGIVLDSGYNLSYAVPIYEGYALPHATLSLELGGRDVTEYLKNLIIEKGCESSYINDYEIVRDIKEKRCYIADDYFREETYINDKLLDIYDYKLPDGKIISLFKGMYSSTEILFQPYIINKNIWGLHEMTYHSIMKCDADIRKDLFSNILFNGGNTMLKGISQRLKNELNYMTPVNTEIGCIIPPSRHVSAFVGGSNLASLSTFQKMCISKLEYNEYGENIVNRKCF